LNRNVLFVEQGFHNELLYSDRLTATKVGWVTDKEMAAEMKCTAKFRYRQPDRSVTIRKREDDQLDVIFDEPQRAITPGQAVVFYDGDVCLGGGTIDKVYKKEEAITYL
jgi:tRNA-specific 2-thiouridylase